MSAHLERELGVAPGPGPSPPRPQPQREVRRSSPHKGRGQALEGSRAKTHAAPASICTHQQLWAPRPLPCSLPQGSPRSAGPSRQEAREKEKGLTDFAGRLPRLLFQLPRGARVRAVQALQAQGPRRGEGHGTRGRGLPGTRRKQVRWEAWGSLGVGAEEHQGRGRRVPQTCGGALGERVRSSCRPLIWVGGIERSGREEGRRGGVGLSAQWEGRGLGAGGGGSVKGC